MLTETLDYVMLRAFRRPTLVGSGVLENTVVYASEDSLATVTALLELAGWNSIKVSATQVPGIQRLDLEQRA